MTRSTHREQTYRVPHSGQNRSPRWLGADKVLISIDALEIRGGPELTVGRDYMLGLTVEDVICTLGTFELVHLGEDALVLKGKRFREASKFEKFHTSRKRHIRYRLFAVHHSPSDILPCEGWWEIR